MCFPLIALAILPLAGWIGWATEQLAERLVVGGSTRPSECSRRGEGIDCWFNVGNILLVLGDAMGTVGGNLNAGLVPAA